MKNEVHFTHLDRKLWPEGYTKKDLIQYYQQIAPYILPYLKDRPVMLHRFPNGISEESFYQKDIRKHFPPDWIKTALIPHEDHDVEYILINNEASLLFVANMSCIDLHPFLSHVPKINYPDYLVLDLDPSEIEFSLVIKVALALHEYLEERKIINLCKTSGSRGLHIFMPLHREFHYDEAKKIASHLAEMAHQWFPDFTSIVRNPQKNKNKIYLDYLRNTCGQTVIAPYSLRPKPHAPVSTPLTWDEVNNDLNPPDFNIQTIFSRLEKKGDLFKEIFAKINKKSLMGLL